MCGHKHSRGRCQWDRPCRPDNLLTIIINIIILRRPGRAGGGALGAGRWADEQSSRRPSMLSLMAINYKPDTSQRGAAGVGWARGIVTTCRIAGTWNTWGVEEVGELRPDAMVGLGQRLVRKVSSCRGLRLIQGSEADARHGRSPLIGLIGLACPGGGARSR